MYKNTSNKRNDWEKSTLIVFLYLLYMDPGDQPVSLETFNTWKVDALREYLSNRGLATEGTKAELAALSFSAHFMKLPLKLTDSQYTQSTRKDYEKLLLIGNDIILPDPLTISGGWLNENSGISKWPPVFVTDIVNFLSEKGTSETLKKHMDEYKVGKAYEYLQSDFIKEIFYHSITVSSKVCFVRGKCTPSQRLRDEDHTVWICVVKETGEVKSAFCSCTAGLGQTCNHVAALLFRLESANKLGMTACTSLPCTWNVPTSTQIQPTLIKDMNLVKSRHGKVKSRQLVASSKSRYQPQHVVSVDKESLLDSLRIAVPNACLFKGIDEPEAIVKDQYTATSIISVQEKQLEDLYLCNMVKIQGIDTTESFVKMQPSLDGSQIYSVQEKTIGQSENSIWHCLRKGRITASNFYNVHTRMNTYNANHSTSMAAVLSNIMGDQEINPNIRALKYGRESEPVAKELYYRQYQKDHINATVQECGIFLDKNDSFLAASPDMLVSCDCCTSGLLEIKSTLVQKCDVCSKFCVCNLPNYLYIENGSIQIKTNHRYFCQIQGQMYITDRKWCDFFVYSCNGTFLKRVHFQDSYFSFVKENIISFFKLFVAPEFILRRTQLNDAKPVCIPDSAISSSTNAAITEPMEVVGGTYFCTVCKCEVLEKENIKSFGQRSICCDLCDKWFHFKCVGINKSSLNNMSNWLCSHCKYLP